MHLTQAVVYMSLAPKSNALYKAYEHAKTDALQQLAEPVPLVIRNAPTRLMKELDYGKGYQYAHDAADKLTTLQCLPDSLAGRSYYEPTEEGRKPSTRPGWKPSKPGRRNTANAMKILIVEDDAAIRLELARFLEKYGYTCLCPADFTGIAAKAAETQPDLALLDINLPCQDGFSALPPAA